MLENKKEGLVKENCTHDRLVLMERAIYEHLV